MPSSRRRAPPGPAPALDRLKAAWDGPVAYPVAVAVAAAGHGIALEPALAAYLQAVAANWVSAGVRLIPLGQSDGQRVLAALEPVVAATAQRALTAALDDIGSSAFRADLASARHETQYTRLFRSDVFKINMLSSCLANGVSSAGVQGGGRWSAGRRSPYVTGRARPRASLEQGPGRGVQAAIAGPA